jgi:hypothetical protein
MKTRHYLISLTILGLLVAFSGCQRAVRHYAGTDTQRVRVAVDSTVHDDYDRSDVDDWSEEPIFEDVEYDGNVKNKKSAIDEYNKFIRGGE